MSSATQSVLVKDAWQTPRNARTFQAFVALTTQEIAARIRQLRADKGNPPQTLVAVELEVSERAYQSWENGEARPNYSSLQKLAAYYGTTSEWILTGSPGQDAPAAAETAPGDARSAQLDRIEAKLDAIMAALEPTATPDAGQQLRQLLADAVDQQAGTSAGSTRPAGRAADGPR